MKAVDLLLFRTVWGETASLDVTIPIQLFLDVLGAGPGSVGLGSPAPGADDKNVLRGSHASE